MVVFGALKWWRKDAHYCIVNSVYLYQWYLYSADIIRFFLCNVLYNYTQLSRHIPLFQSNIYYGHQNDWILNLGNGCVWRFQMVEKKTLIIANSVYLYQWYLYLADITILFV